MGPKEGRKELDMPVSTSTVATEHASKYLQQLCKHWSHKFTVEFTAKSGRVPFSDTAEVTFSADHAALHMRLSAADPAQIERYENVVADHLKRFAFREELHITWNA
jgi:hypothetical protein